MIDDNPSIHDDIRKVLQAESGNVTAAKLAKAELLGNSDTEDIQELPVFEVDSAFQGKEGLQLITNSITENRPYALSFVDIRMPPGWDGVETISHIWKVDDDIQVVICTAHSDYSWADVVKSLGFTDRWLILKKPFDSAEIRQLACSLTKKWALGLQAKNQLALLESQITMRTAQIKATLESTTDGVLSVGIQQKILNYNQKFIDMWTFNEDILKSSNSEVFLQSISDNLIDSFHFLSRIRELNNKPDVTSFDVLHCKNGRIIECYTQPQKIENSYQGRVWCFRDVTKSKELEDMLAYQATHDILTGLPNRGLLYDRLQLAIVNAKRSKTFFAVIFFDLDRFKFINDTLGHNAGDTFLKDISKRLLSCIRENDTLSRLGGDEFVIVISELKKVNDVIPIVNKCLEALMKPIIYKENEFRMSSSVGVSLYPQDGQDIQTLLKNADMAMYRAKETSPGGFKFYTNDLNVRASEHLLLESNLRKALQQNEFELYYQPLINLEESTIIGVEALLRWNHPKLGFIPPLTFIPIAEEIGLISPIGEWVLNEACKQYKIWQDEGLSSFTLAINLSPQQLMQHDIVELIESILKKNDINPKFLELEFTESCLMNEVTSITNKIIALKKLGISLAIDDFGTGYSSLSYLRMFPINKIKIDKSFIHYISPNPDDTSIIIAIIAIAKSLKLRVLAEGVETEEQLNFLRDNHCQEAQGYYFSRPLTAKKCTQFLEKGPIHISK